MCRTRIGTQSFAKRSKKVCLIVTQRALGQSPKGGNLALLKVLFDTPKVSNGLLDTKCSSMFGCILDLLIGFFDPVPSPKRVFILSLCFFFFLFIFFLISFLDNSGFFRNNHLEDKYPKINLDKVQIIHNLIVIQSSLLFLCMHTYFKHKLSTNHKII